MGAYYPKNKYEKDGISNAMFSIWGIFEEHMCVTKTCIHILQQ